MSENEFEWKLIDDNEVMSRCKHGEFELKTKKNEYIDGNLYDRYIIYTGTIKYIPLDAIIFSYNGYSEDRDMQIQLEGQTKVFEERLDNYNCQPCHWG